jgi:5-(carboxyamino)imidazole ribonucleotide synthase
MAEQAERVNFPFRGTIGIIGGGQLGKMLIEASRPWNLKNIVLEQDTACPASAVADRVICGSLNDPEALRNLAAACDVLTFEIEHVGVETLLELEQEGKRIIPSPKVLDIIRDKGRQKQCYYDHGLPTTEFRLVNHPDEWKAACAELPGSRMVAKCRTGGYDGRGVDIFRREDLMNDSYSPAFDAPSLLEVFVEDALELAVIVARDEQGNTCTWPSIQMEFHPTANLVEYLFMPAEVPASLEKRARNLAMDAVSALNGVGVFAVELLCDRNEDVWINEIAPRPHNSGHHTIEACYTSQYEQLNRILCGLPLGDPSLIQPAAMINLLGPEDLEGAYRLDGANEALAIPGVYIHLYNKGSIRAMRKMGHVTVMAEHMDELKAKASKVRELLRFVPA